MHNGGGVSKRDGRGDGSGVVRKVRSGRRARRAIARGKEGVVRGLQVWVPCLLGPLLACLALGLLGEHEQHAYRVVGERASGRTRREQGMPRPSASA